MRAIKRLLRPALVVLGLRPPPPPDPEALTELTEESLGRLLLRTDAGLGLFRLVHLLDAISRGPAPNTILSIGSGLGTQEAFLALRYPDAQVIGVDLRRPKFLATLPNLRLIRGDLFDPGVRRTLPAADFVYSIECLEHIEADDAVVELMVSKLKPGGRLFLLVPFATDADLADPDFCRREREENEHVRPGYGPARLRSFVARHGLVEEQVASTYRFPLQPLVASGVSTIPFDFLLPRWREIFELVSSDVRDGLATSRMEATGIRLLARRPPSA
ncbi:MAG: class I SAM-dependent methyltransferase [Thermoanaerobaculia bacterium]